MPDPILDVRGPAPIDAVDLVSLRPPGASKTAPAFEQVFAQAMQRVEQAQKTSQDKLDSFLRGDDQELHDVVLSAQRADLAFDYFLQARNKVVQAYQEIMRMQM